MSSDFKDSNNIFKFNFPDSIFWGTSIYGEDMFKVILPGDGNNNDMSLNNSHISKQKGNFFLGNIEDIIPLELAPNLRTKRWDNMGKEYYCPYGYFLVASMNKSLPLWLEDSYILFKFPFLYGLS